MTGLFIFFCSNAGIIGGLTGGLVVFALAFLVCSLLAGLIFKKFKKTKRRIKKELFGGLTMKDLGRAVNQAKNAEIKPPEKSVSSATNIYLPKIEKDFPDYHLPEAKAAISILISEFFAVRYENASSFVKAETSPGLFEAVSKTEESHNISDVCIHRITITGYVRTKEFATITYQISGGYRLDGKITESRFEAESTIRYLEEETAVHMLTCKNCGGAIDSSVQKFCPYCGSGIVWDTRVSWQFTSVKEIM